MPVYFVPTYRDLFSGPVPEPEDLLFDIPSDIVLNTLAFINAQVVLGLNSLESQMRVLDRLTQRVVHVLPDFSQKIYSFLRAHRANARFFVTPYLLDFMQYELQLFRDIPEHRDTNPDQEVRILKAYFVFAEKAKEKSLQQMESVVYVPADEFWFQKRTWPMIIGQHEINHLPHPGVFAVKALVFLQFFLEHPTYNQYVQTFLDSSQQETIWHYVVRLLRVMELSLQKPNENGLHLFRLTLPPDDFKPLFEGLSITSSIFKSIPNNSKNHTGIRANPIFNFRGEYYVVLHWHFLYQKVYKGLIFDFYQRSGIQKEFRTLPDFLSMIGKEVTESRVFQPIMKNLLAKKHTILEFDSVVGQNKKPDLYFRSGKKILLIELKDLMLPADVISNYSFEALSEQLEIKFVKNEKDESKGIIQILNQIKKINEEPLQYDQFEKKGIKKRNIIIYPVIIYTNIDYSLPGIEDYLRKRFKSELNSYKSNAVTWNLGQVHDLVMISLDFFFRFNTEEDNIDLFSLIDTYNHRLTNRMQKFQKKPVAPLALRLFPGFESIHSDRLRNKKPDINKLFQVLDIQIDLPSE